ncbi:MAG: YraN family protein [Novosphingobium sp.]
MNSRAEREAKGRRGETLAAWYLRLMGWRIVARRVKTPRGEIDLIARRGKVVAFVEVKWRASAAELDFAIDDYRLRRVRAAAEAVGHRYAKADDEQRIDVVLLAPGRFPRHMANALMP